MALINMNKIFDELQTYIDKKIGDSSALLEKLFADYNMEEIGLHIDEILTVSASITDVITVSNYINSVIKCSTNMAYIQYAPTASKDAKRYMELTEAMALQTKNDMHDAHAWAQNPRNLPVNDGEHLTGYSAYHWSEVAKEFTNAEKYFWRDGTLGMLADSSFGGFKIINLADGIADYDAVNRKQLNLKLDKAGDTMEGDLIIHAGLNVSDDISTNGSLYVGSNANGNSAISFNYPDVSQQAVMFWNKTTGQFEFDNVEGFGNVIWNAGNLTPTDFALEAEFSSHIANVANPHTVTKAQIGLGSADDTTDANKPISIATQAELDLKFEKTGGVVTGAIQGVTPVGSDELTRKDYVDTGLTTIDTAKYDKIDFVSSSAGGADAGKPVKLDATGGLDPSILGSGLYPVGMFTPEAALEYPDTTGEGTGAYWGIGELPPEGYTFVGGDLIGITLFNGDAMINGSAEWGYLNLNIDPDVYYHVDGSKALTAAFSGGGQQLKSIAPGSDDTDAVTMSQITSFATDFVMRDGTLDMEANLDLGGYKTVNMTTGTASSDGATYGQVTPKYDKSGGLISGTVLVESADTGPSRVGVKAGVDKYAHFEIVDHVDNTIGSFGWKDVAGKDNLGLFRHDTATGNIVGQLILHGAGNVSIIDSVTPTETNHLTPKSYVDAHKSDTNNPHSVTKAQVGLTNADDTSDADKPISTATQTALDLKADDTDLTAHTADVANPHAVTTAQIGALPLTGGTMTGQILGIAPVAAEDLTRKDYVDAANVIQDTAIALNTAKVTGADRIPAVDVTLIDVVTQAEYDAIVAPRPATTLYVIVG